MATIPPVKVTVASYGPDIADLVVNLVKKKGGTVADLIIVSAYLCVFAGQRSGMPDNEVIASLTDLMTQARANNAEKIKAN